MSNFKRPGVFVSESLLSTQAVGTAPDGSTAAFCGASYRGPTDGPRLVSSWAEFVQIYGGFSGIATTLRYLPYALYQYFTNGGGQAWVQRVVGSGVASATASLNDVAATPHATLGISAKNAGVWGSSVSVGIVDRDAPNGRFDFNVYFGGTTDNFIVERFTNVTMDKTDDRYVLSVVNALQGGSNVVVLTDSASPSSFPANKPATGTTTLSGGSDGSVPGSSDYNNAVALFDQVPDPIVMNLPGNTTSAVIDNALSYCANRGNAFLVIDTASGLDANGAVSYAAQLAGSDPSYGAVYYPWQNIVDAASSLPGSTVLLPPGGSIVARYMLTDQQRGPFKAAAGYSVSINGAVSNERKLTNSDYDLLNTSNVNAIRQQSGVGIIVMGAKTLQKTGPTSYVPIRRSLIYVKQTLINLSSFAIFEPNDDRLWALVAQAFTSFLTDYWSQGGLKGDQASDAFTVTCDNTNNTPQTVAAGEVHADVGVALEYPAEFIVVSVAQWEGGSSAVASI